MSEEISFDWDSVVTADQEKQSQPADDFVVLPKGVYDFEIKKFTKGIHQPKPGGKLKKPCPKADVEFLVRSEKGSSYFHENFFLSPSTMWRVTALFICTGLRKHGDSAPLPWDSLVGATGRARIGIDSYTKQNGEDRSRNTIESFIEPKQDEPSAQGSSEDLPW